MVDGAPEARGTHPEGVRSLLVFADDWGRHPSSCQHLVSQLLPRYPVWWVNTIGTRRPSLDLATLRRGVGKLRQWLRPAAVSTAADAAANPCVLNPRMWPFFSTRFDRWTNRKLLLRQLTPVLRDIPRPLTALTTIPLVADLIGPLPVDRWVYYCVDDFSAWPGLDHRAIRRMEKMLIDRVDVLIAVSETLQAKLRQAGRPVHLLTHGVDANFWQYPPPAAVPQLEGLARPLIAFWGLVDRRMDVALVHRLAAELTQGTIILVGPESDPDRALLVAPRVVRVPALDFQQLPAVARAASVLVMPYADLPVTRAMQPLKLKEYLSTGKPTVVRDLPATRPWADCLDLADSPEAFARAVRLRLETGLPEEQARARARLRDESWDRKAEQLAQWALASPRSADS